MHAFHCDLASTYLYRVVVQRPLQRRNSLVACLHIKWQSKSLKGALQHSLRIIKKFCWSVVESPEKMLAKMYSAGYGLEFTIDSRSQIESIPSALTNDAINPKFTATGWFEHCEVNSYRSCRGMPPLTARGHWKKFRWNEKKEKRWSRSWLALTKGCNFLPPPSLAVSVLCGTEEESKCLNCTRNSCNST